MWVAFVTTILFSISAVCGQRAALLFGGTETHFWRLIFAATVLGIYAHGFQVGFDTVALPLFVLSGAIGFGMGDVAYFQALPRLGSRLSVMMVLCLSSPLAATIEWWWLGTSLSPLEILSSATILAGVALALAPGQHLVITRKDFVLGVLFGAVAAFGQGYGAVLSRKAFALAAAAGENVDGITAAYQRILGGLGITGLCVLAIKRPMRLPRPAENGRGPGGTDIVSPWRRWQAAWPWIVLTGLAGPAFGVSCFQWALKTTPTGIVLPIVATTPIVIIPFALVIEGERPSRRSLLGGAIAVAGAVALAIVEGNAK